MAIEKFLQIFFRIEKKFSPNYNFKYIFLKLSFLSNKFDSNTNNSNMDITVNIFIFFVTESFRPPLFHAIGQSDKKGFDLGRKENLKQVFGNNFFKAFLPIPTR